MSQSISLVARDNDPVAQSGAAVWARDALKEALAARGIAVGAGGKLTIEIAGPLNRAAADLAGKAGIPLPKAAESFAIFLADDRLVAFGADARGLVYALTELADRVEYGEPELFGTDLPLIETPSAKVRCIARTFASEAEDKAWFNDRTFWSAYLSMLACNRFNRFSLMLGLQYDYPYHNNLISDVYFHFPYPFLVSLPAYGVKVVGLPDAERDANLDMLRFIGRECARRGLEFQLGLWTQRYDFDDVPNASYDIEGVSAETFAPYCRDALTAILKAVPEITGLTFRIHVEGGIAEGDYAFWKTAFTGITAVGRPIEINMHGKGLDQTTIAIARETGMPVAASPKYIAEHIGLPYHPSAIREREYPPMLPVTNREQLSLGSRRFLRYSYGDLLSKDRDWKVVYRMWPGTQRLLMWGDPVFAAQYGRSASFCGSDGIEWMEPLTFKGRAGSGMTGGRFGYKAGGLRTRYDWQKYAYQYRLWGRLSYFPGAGANSWKRYLTHHFGAAADECERALATASRILPLVTQSHGPSVANNNYWPEIYTNLSVFGERRRRPYGFDMDEPTRFGNAPTFDPQFFANAREYAAALLAGKLLHSYSPLDVASWLDHLASETELALVRAKSCSDFQKSEVQRLVIDSQIVAALGRFFAEKHRAACSAEIFLATHAPDARLQTIGFLKRARLAWRTAAEVSAAVYQDDLTFGPAAHLRGSWQGRLADFDRELNDVEIWRLEDGPAATAGEDEAKAALLALQEWKPSLFTRSGLASPPTFVPGEPFRVDLELPSDGTSDREVIFHYRHVNQAERWQRLAMTGIGGSYSAVIPPAHTDSPFHLQFYATALTGGQLTMVPGLGKDLANQPYLTATQ